MKQYLLAALLCFLLCGCTQDPLPTETAPTAAPPEEALPAASMYAPGHPLEIPDVLQVYPLSISNVQGMRAFDGGVLLFSGHGATTLTLLTGGELTVAASHTLDFQLDQEDPSLRFHGDTLSYFDPVRRETVVLDSSLKSLRQIALPEDAVDAPILSHDRTTLYYCTSTAIRAWDLESGIRRAVKELSYESQRLVGLHSKDTLLQCRVTDNGSTKDLFLTTDSGILQTQWDGSVSLVTASDRYYAALPTGNLQTLVFGSAEIPSQVLYPEDLTGQCCFLPDIHTAAVWTVLDEGSVTLSCYALGSGICRGTLTLPQYQNPKSIVCGSGTSLYILTEDPEADRDTIYRWEVPEGSAGSPSYTAPYRTAGDPDLEGLAQCQRYAAEIGAKYGLEILVWEDALSVQPWDYVFEPEHQVGVLMQELQLLDQRLSQYPQEVLTATASHFTRLAIALVRQINGSPASGSLDTATGVQFFDGTDAYVTIAVGKYARQALYHELFHVMETHLLNETSAFDDWDILNPAGFAYSYNYSPRQDSGVYLNGESRAFIDTYSMSFPKEDRARILEYAMLPQQQDLFSHKILQEKLKKLCFGLRQAYGLRKSPETFPWEQYLEESLAYQE